MRYYIYISDYKLDMLYEQIRPALRRRISAELKVDLKLASLTVRESEQPDATRMTKLHMVERYIERHHHVGDVSDPGPEFFRGTMDMQWGWLSPRERLPRAHGQTMRLADPSSHESHDCPSCGERDLRKWEERILGDERISPVAIFRGFQARAQACDFVLLGGSRRHVLGSGVENDPAAQLTGGSLMYGLLEALESCVSQLDRFKPHEGGLWKGTTQYAIEAGMLMRMKGPRQRLKFLAVPYGKAELKTGTSWPGSGLKWMDKTLHGVIGTPIYIAHG